LKAAVLLSLGHAAYAARPLSGDVADIDTGLKQATYLDDSAPVLAVGLSRTRGDNAAWTAAPNERFAGVSVGEAKALMGVSSDALLDLKKSLQIFDEVSDSIPDEFSSETTWPGCVHPIRNQGHCGSCWAFGASEVLSDRFCIASNTAVDVVLSPEQLVSCDWEGNMGCNGGNPRLAWEYMEAAGLVTDDCFPYAAGNGSAPACTHTCADGSPRTSYRAKFGSTKGFHAVEGIQTNLMQFGPIEAAFTVYDDFITYKSGVYEKSPGASMLGGHAVKVVGWGVDKDSGKKYWRIANSWGTTWGEDGYFRILRGEDECGIENGMVAGQASV